MSTPANRAEQLRLALVRIDEQLEEDDRSEFSIGYLMRLRAQHEDELMLLMAPAEV